MTGLLGIENLTREEVQAILDRARDFQPGEGHGFRRFDLLRGRMVVNLFFEASTRTRTSFEIAAKRLGADAVSITAQASSVAKGESLVDTLNTLAAMRPDAIIMRHAASGAPHFLQRHLETPIINAGDGTHEHPTQALLDARTILEKYELLDRVPVTVRKRIESGEGGEIPETPKMGDPAFARVRNEVIGSNRLAVNAAVSRARELGWL
jgi:aspartate carbamoyltransferase catalytic subunit